MAIAFRGHVTGSTTNGANITLNLASPTSGSAPSAGDVVLVVSCAYNRAGNEGRIGNALSYASTNDFNSTTRRHRVAWKAWATGENSVVIEGSANASDGTAAVAVWFSGVDTSNPFSVTNSQVTGNGINPNPPAITPADNNCAIVVLAGSGSNDAAPGTLASYTVLSGVTGNDSNPDSAAVAYRILSGGSGVSEDPAAFSAWITGNWGVVTAALQEPAAVTHYTMPAATGGVALAGVDVALTGSRKLPAATGDFTLEGAANLLPRGLPDAWNRFDTGVTYSNGDRTAALDPYAGVLSSTGHVGGSSELVYIEVECNSLADPVDLQIRMGEAGAFTQIVITADGYLYDGFEFYEYFSHLEWGAGDVVQFAYRAASSTAWVRVNGGPWNTDSGENPVTNTGGFPLSTDFGDVFVSAVSSEAGSVTYTINTGTELWADAPPSGYSEWYGTQPSAGGTLDADAGVFALAGQASALTAARKLSSVTGSFTLAGQPATFLGAHFIRSTVTPYTLAGQPAALRATRMLPAVKGAFVLGGQTATLRYGHVTTAVKGTFALAGVAATLRTGRGLAAATGSFVLNGREVSFGYGSAEIMPASTGTIAFVGYDTKLAYSRKFPVTAGTFALAGQAAVLRGRRVTLAVAGTFALAGQTAGLKFGRATIAARGMFTLAGLPTTLRYTRKMAAAASAVALNGPAVNLVYSGAGAKSMPAAAGVFALSGKVAIVRRTAVLPMFTASIVLDGIAANLNYTMAVKTGALAVRETGDAASLAGTVTVTVLTGVFAATEANDNAAFAGGTLALPASGELNAYEAGDSAAFYVSLETAQPTLRGRPLRFGRTVYLMGGRTYSRGGLRR